jgi:hypothetical protein
MEANVTHFAEDYESSHPINAIAQLAKARRWKFEQVTENRIAMAVVGRWSTYSLTFAWSAEEEVLRLHSCFELKIDPSPRSQSMLYEVLNLINNVVWSGAFVWWEEARLMLWRYGLPLTGGQVVSDEQINCLIHAAIVECEKFYPVFHSVVEGKCDPATAMNMTLADTLGSA